MDCPVVSLSEAEFQDFYSCVKGLQARFGKQWGMVKVRPPAGFRARSEDYEGSVGSLQLTGPIEQNTFGKGGVYQCTHIQRKGLTVAEYQRRVKPGQPSSELSTDKVEEMFWSTLGYSPPLYGADVQLSLMDTPSSWNLGALRSLLSCGLKAPLGGINTPYCYFGAWKSFFCWHTEDLELSGINYLHYGRPKYWYCVPASQRGELQKELRELFPECFASCPEFTRHKTLMVSPRVLRAKNPGLRISRAVQSQNQFVIVFGGSFHCGFNSGFNIAEAINFATPNWLPQLLVAKSCKCNPDSVVIDILRFGKQLIEEKMGDEPGVAAFVEKASQKVREQRRKKVRKELVNWAQCENCDVWRRLRKGQRVGSEESFECEDVGLVCKLR